MLDGKHLTLAIETSCDETSAALMAEGRQVLSNVISSQIDIHKAFGGVVPEIASRHHLTNINHVIKTALDEAGVSIKDVDLIGVTKGPGLVGALLVGIATAKAFALSTGKPLVGVHHIKGHLSANYIAHPDLEPPFTALVVSGGHTELIRVSGYDSLEYIGGTRDDAAGEAYDKVARVLGLGYPGGPLIDAAAKKGDPHAIGFKRVYLEKDSYDFSFSGIKTGVLNHINTEKQAGRWQGSDQSKNIADIAASFQQAVLEVIVAKSVKAAEEYNDNKETPKLVVAGGVAANSRLRIMLGDACGRRGIELFMPPPVLCTDNAAMIGCAAYYSAKAGKTDGLSLDAYADLSL